MNLGATIHAQAWVLRRCISIFNLICRKNNFPRDPEIRRIFKALDFEVPGSSKEDLGEDGESDSDFTDEGQSTEDDGDIDEEGEEEEEEEVDTCVEGVEVKDIELVSGKEEKGETGEGGKGAVQEVAVSNFDTYYCFLFQYCVQCLPTRHCDMDWPILFGLCGFPILYHILPFHRSKVRRKCKFPLNPRMFPWRHCHQVQVIYHFPSFAGPVAGACFERLGNTALPRLGGLVLPSD